MDFKSNNKGKSISTSTPSFSFRYNAEDEEVEQVYTPTSDPETQKVDENLLSSTGFEGKEETKSRDSSPILTKASKRSGSLEDGGSPEPWRLFTEIKGRITKTVEEKIEEIKSDRIKLGKKKKLLNTSSLSDSEERSEASSSIKDLSEKSISERQRDTVADSDLGDVSDTSLTPDRETPIVTEVDISETTPSKEALLHLSSVPKKTRSPPASPISEKSIHFPHKKPKGKSRGKIEMGVEAIEETVGKEEGRITQTDVFSSNQEKNHTFVPTISVRAAAYLALLGVLYVFVNIPQFLVGVILGGFLSFEFSVWANTCFQRIFGNQNAEFPKNNLNYENNDVFSPLPNQSSTTSYEGWINEFCYEYQPEIYHVTQTETVYIRLEGSILKLASPRQKISKRAIWNEPSYKLRFDRERTYEISDCDVVLLPDKLAHKRIWSKKYPICIILKPDSHLGTRYRERGTPSLDFVSYKGHTGRKSPDEDQNNDETTDGPPIEEKKKDTVPSDDEGEVIFYSEDEDEDDGLSSDYVKIPTSIINKSNIYLFARTDREKDLWFRRLGTAAKFKSDVKSEETEDNSPDKEVVAEEEKTKSHAQLCYSSMSKLIGKKVSYQGTDESMDISEEEDEGVTWLNLFLGRILFDPMHDPYWIKQIQEKIQKKLSAIKVPPFMEELLVSQIELSDSIPIIDKTGLPRLNCDGIWVDLDIVYTGTFKMTIDTKINIIKLKNSKLEGALSKLEGNESPELQERSISKSAIFDSEVEDTAESSDDEVDPEDPNKMSSNSRNTSHKVLQMVDKIASSKYFQQVTDNKYVKKALEGVSNTTISLVVEVRSLVGTVVLNFPPPPSDRLWYGFRPSTKLNISAKPKVGQRGINMAYITNYIEKKLLREFEKLLVMPNMDDLIIPVMNKTKPS